MINDYNQFADAMDLKSGDINKCVDALAELKEMSPAIFNMYDAEYRKRKQTRQQEQAKQHRQAEAKKQEQKAMYMTYNEFKKMFDEMGKVSLMRSDAESPAVKLSKFSREHPAVYQEYRQRMHNEDNKERRFKG